MKNFRQNSYLRKRTVGWMAIFRYFGLMIYGQQDVNLLLLVSTKNMDKSTA